MEVKNDQEKKIEIVQLDKEESNLKSCTWIDLVHKISSKNNLNH
jgi:hypothetical protein